MNFLSSTKMVILTVATVGMLVGCGESSSGSSDDSSVSASTNSGVFVDAKVKGLRYQTPSLSGYTGNDGVFHYKNGEKIEFFLGNISLGWAIASKLMTPYTLTHDTDIQNPSQKTINIALLLQNFDANRSDKTCLDVSRLKGYKFKDINLSDSTDTTKSKINTLLSTGSFQKYVDSHNHDLIDTPKAKEHLQGNVKKLVCNLKTIEDDSGFTDIYPADIKWSGSSDTVEDIQRVFNNARAKDSTITQKLVMPPQSVWDDMSIEQRGLYLLNNERYYRGLKPYEGISKRVSAISQKYADLLYQKGAFGHNEDGSPFDRMDRDNLIKNNKDFFRYGENLYVYAKSSHYVTNPIARAIYGFIYNDDASTGGSMGHRRFCLANELKDNSGKDGEEGLIGFAIAKGKNYSKYPNMYSTIVVMNGFDPSSSWDHSTTIKVPFCTPQKESTDTKTDTKADTTQRFQIDATNGVVTDTKTSLMWQNSNISHNTRDKAISRCNNLTFAGYSDWRLPTMAQDKVFHFEMNKNGNTPKQAFDRCTAEVTTDGYVRTKKGAQTYGGNPGDPINFRGGANIRCVRDN